ncbi:hypothetical protein BDZ94DRAFT_1318862 [Collybia nuda]|uniref:DUF6535 domain-containing protein n=1 Tax=Collybia nuda TaxID=64659 RepID=A0A9P5YEM4_9AGAR|nr:hypothetical protein BDZ94DRAFT_1318862 [Collybia nuda]
MSVERRPPSPTRKTELVGDASSDERNTAGTLGLDEQYGAKNSESRIASHHWSLQVSDDRMCERWRVRINTMIILAGVYSYTATMLTLQAYERLHESPTKALARHQLQTVFGESRDPAMTHRGAPTMTPFKASPSAIFAIALFVASLGLSLATFAISLLCKWWLREYERCDSPVDKNLCLKRGLPCPGLRAWRIPTVIAFLPILLQGVVIIFFIGIHVLIWLVHPIVGALVTIGEVVLVLGVIAMLYPVFLRD